MSEIVSEMAGTIQASQKRSGRTSLVLALLTLSFALSFMDRSAINLVLDPIKKEFALSDTVLGLIAGFGFVVVYSSLGLVIGRIGDRSNRVRIVSVSIVIWSVMTAVTASASSVVQLALLRLGVAAGEAGLQGPAHSIIADHFGKERRSRALAIYSTGPYIGIFFGFTLAGWVAQYYGWRMVFLAAGLPGVILALALFVLIPEPRRGQMEGAQVDATLYSVKDTFSFLVRQPTFILCLIGFCLTSYTNFALSVWVPSFLRRVHHLNSAEVGTYAGTVKGVVGVLGAVAGGVLVERFSAKKEHWRLLLPALASLLAGPVLVIFFLGSSLDIAIPGLMVGVFLSAIHVGPVYAAVQSVAKLRMRASASSAILLGASFFGNGIAPLTIGMLNDGLSPQMGDLAIRYSLLTASVTSVLGALCLWQASRTFVADQARARSEPPHHDSGGRFATKNLA